MIVELYGCPGCGKTYLVHKITGKDDTVAMSDNKIKSSLINVAKKVSLFIPESVKIKKSLLEIVKDEPQEGLYIKRSVKEFVDNIVLLAFGYKHIKKDMFMAEGLIHRIVSMAVNFGWGEEIVDRIIDTISNLLGNVSPVYLYVDPEVCFESAKERNRHDTEMDELQDDKLKSYIHDFKRLFDHITVKYQYIKITREDYSALEEIL